MGGGLEYSTFVKPLANHKPPNNNKHQLLRALRFAGFDDANQFGVSGPSKVGRAR